LRVWIDLANSPHPLLFAPVAEQLRRDGAEVSVTLRDHAQTAELALARFPDAEVIGGPSPGGRASKLSAIARRVADLRAWGRAARPDVALSHNSYAQLVAARTLGIPGVTAMDFEHQPANHVAFRCAAKILVPEAVPVATIRRQGARSSKLVRYEGLKEEIYLADFEPDREILERIGVERRPGAPLVVARTAPAGAAYHREENPILSTALERLTREQGAVCVVLARLPEQAAAIRGLGLDGVVIPERAIDSRSLLVVADAFLGAGGTMTREAALLGVPTYSLFSGPPVAVDRWLEDRGLLTRVADAAQIPAIGPRADSGVDLTQVQEAGRRLLDLFSRTVLESATS
jgi:predicted glycosyltransferase